ncbi:MAG TPA: Gldg family protein [Vicinamibacterales bacterium]|nr:Gldg family protein [Vicinamibacterales bacterium]
MLKRILGLVGWLGVALVLAAVAIRFLKPEWQWYQTLAMAGLGCTLLYVLSQWREIAREFSGRQARYGTLAAASILVVLGILAAINYLAERHNKRWDLTAAKQFTLSEQTQKVVRALDKPVRVTVFARTEDFPRFRERLDEYQYLSSQLQIEYIDPEKRPALAERLKESSLGTVVLEYEGRVQRVTSEAEQDLTNGLIKVVQGTQHKVYFVQGHGERDTSGSDGPGYGAISRELGSDNFTTESLVLLQQDVPADASVLVIAGPKSDLLPQEVDKLRGYLAKGGKLLALIDPPQSAGAAPLSNLVGLLKEWSIDVGTNAVLDPMSQLRNTDPSVPVAAPPYPSHPITNTFRLLTAYPYARSVRPVDGATGSKVPTSFVQSGPNSWAESDLTLLTTRGEARPEFDKGDVQGPVSLAVALSAPVEGATPPPADQAADAPGQNKPETRIVVVGDSDFAANNSVGVIGNRDMFLNIVNWLAQQENLIAVRPRDPEDRRITLSAGQDRLIFWFTVLIIPGLILLAGVQTWWRRR